MLKTDQQALVENRLESVSSLCEKYGGMLFGYLLEVLKDRKRAEEVLVKLFCDFYQQFN
ncbi:hypothetical protein [Pedobacter sp. L105]|uniref:hypothetical protein n=1 Tax=Pedobacter sp. L105 TaxID=1641871 RepID=UPI00131B3B09|nr:hypothetical protein [Pedobacter sp. L105]